MTRKFEDLFRFSIFICAVPPNESKKTVSVDVWTQCPPPSSRFRVFTGMSLEQCAAECEARPACAVLGYLRTPHVCELYEQPAGVDGSGKATSASHCLLVQKGEDSCGCSHWSVYDRKSKTCTVQECEPVRIVDHGKILGNRYDVGAKLRVLCDVGYVAENNMTSMTCGANGSWSHVASCVLKFNKTSVVNSSQSTLESVCPKTKSEFTSNVTQTLPGYPGTEFIFVKQHHTLNDSKNACENMGGHMIKIDTHAKLGAITNLMTKCNGLKIRSWVDGEKEGDDWKYHDGTLMDVGNSSIWNNKYEPKINDTCVRLKKSTFLLVGINNQGCVSDRFYDLPLS
ncbi:uncharacterized protein LOC128225639 isoform X2 [Mya arenaria]|uniref:uncharacterized protein LOC128225639 isoform X2 n=1 Tax=Mya arenaria TaxID=6604 RepID=UPI0022DFE42C|nr:uncharacterized protein LOC128225639 isoform X2 [Mya arenaria]